MKVSITIATCLFAVFLLVSCTTSSRLLTKDEMCDQLVNYRVVIPVGSNAMITNVASEIANGIVGYVNGSLTTLRVGVDKNSDAVTEIDLGATSRDASYICAQGLGPLDYTIKSLSDGRIVVVGGSSAATAVAGMKFLEMVNNGSFNSLREFEYTYRFFDCHESDPLSDLDSAEAKALISDWESLYSSPEWGGVDKDLLESLYALTHRFSAEKGRIAVFSHRGDMGHYPENSLAGIISALLSGADTIEFDLRFTKDFIPVIFHDETLTRMTNYNELKGTNGLPVSSYIKDWTYDQLMQLNLLDYYGNVTEYKIAAVYDGLRLVAGKMQVSFDDKSSSGASFADLFIPLAEDAGACESLILSTYRKFKKLDILEGHVDSSVIDFARNCGSFGGAYSFYSNSTYFVNEFNSNYTSLEENSETWDYLIDNLGKRYVGTNQCYALSEYMRERGMNAWIYQ